MRASAMAFGGMLAIIALLLVWRGMPGAMGASGAGSPELVIGVGGSGDIPAVALIAPGRPPVVVLPGGATDAMQLRNALQNRGCRQISALFMPTSAPFPKGAEVLARGFAICTLAAAIDPRSRQDWSQLQRQALSDGVSVAMMPPRHDGKSWQCELPHCRLLYRKMPEGRFLVELRHDDGDGMLAVFELLPSGELAIASGTGGKMRIAKTSRAQVVVMPLDRTPPEK